MAKHTVFSTSYLEYSATFTAAPVPLPAAVWMFGAAMMGWLGNQKRKMAA